MRIVSEVPSGILDLVQQVSEGKTVLDVLGEKYPEGREATQDVLLSASEGFQRGRSHHTQCFLSESRVHQ